MDDGRTVLARPYMFCSTRALERYETRENKYACTKSLGCNARNPLCLLYPFTLDFASMFAFGYFNAKPAEI